MESLFIRCPIGTCRCSGLRKRTTMFPGIDGFHWSAGHVIFLSLFFAVVMTIAGTVVAAAWRAVLQVRTHQAVNLCWRTNFAELPESDRRCRHELAGRVISRT